MRFFSLARPATTNLGRFRLQSLLALFPVGLCGLCGWLLLQPTGKANVLPPVELAQSSLEGQLEGIGSSQVEALAIDRRGDVVEIGLLLSTIEVRRAEGGFSQFEAQLFNLGDFPVENARVELRLLDRQERFIETIVLATDEAILNPKRWAHLEGMYQVGALSPRIVEERLALTSNQSVALTTYPYGDAKDSPGFLSDLASAFGFLTYEALWTNPRADWVSYQLQFAVDRVIRD